MAEQPFSEQQLVIDPSIEAIEQAIIKILEDMNVYSDVYAGVTVDPQAMPAAAVGVNTFVRGDEQTGGLVEYGWSWQLLLIVDYTVPEAYQVFKTLIVQTLRTFQANPTLNETCYRHIVRDMGRALPFPQRGMYIKTLEVVAEVEEEELYG